MNSERDNILEKVGTVMGEQAESYLILDAATNHLSTALIHGDLPAIEKHMREGESELTRMRSRLLEIMSSLTRFAETRPAEGQKLNTEIKEHFEQSAQNLLEKAREFKRIAERTANLALGGASFATACIQVCGIPPTTYSKPVLRKTEANV